MKQSATVLLTPETFEQLAAEAIWIIAWLVSDPAHRDIVERGALSRIRALLDRGKRVSISRAKTIARRFALTR